MQLTKRLALAAALCSALLTACGGGGGDDEIAPATAADIDSFNALAEYCGTRKQLPSAQPSETLQQHITDWVTVDRVNHHVSTVYAESGWSPFADSTVLMDIYLSDMRGRTASSVGIGYQQPGVRMGVAFNPALPAAGITCTRGLNGFSTPVWRAKGEGILDLADLPAPALDGFEWVANFEPAPGTVVFTLPPEKVDPDTVRLCYRAHGETDWSCEVPSVAPKDDFLRFSLHDMAPGIYVLTGDRPSVQ